MEQLYTETSVKQKTPAKIAALKVILIVGVVILVGIGLLAKGLIMLLSMAALVALVWYWPRFKVEWEYVFCDGQIDFDQILGGEKRKTILRVELDDADMIAPYESHKMDGYRHLPVRDFSSLRPEAKPYAVVTRMEGKEEKVVILFEPSNKMVDMIHTKFPNKSEVRVDNN